MYKCDFLWICSHHHDTNSNETWFHRERYVTFHTKTSVNGDYAWAIYQDEASKAQGYEKAIEATRCTPSDTGNGKLYESITFTDDTKDGSGNWASLQSAVTDTGTSGKYPAWEWANSYGSTNCAGTDYESGWYMPSIYELYVLCNALDTVNEALSAADGQKISDDDDRSYYWSSSQGSFDMSSSGTYAYRVQVKDGWIIADTKSNTYNVCAVRRF